jgi:hypothetical protein
MKNPFQYGGIVEGSAFCNRKQELADLMAAFENSEKLFLYSERRLGKTSLVHTALRELPRGRYTSAYIDLWPTDGEMSFAAAAARAITESMSSTAGQLLEVAKHLFSRLTPSVTADAIPSPADELARHVNYDSGLRSPFCSIDQRTRSAIKPAKGSMSPSILARSSAARYALRSSTRTTVQG